MAAGQKSLRAMVEHWFPPSCSKDVRVTVFKNRPSKHECYVCVATFRDGGLLEMFFFRHKDRTWRVYPPNGERLALRVV